MDPVLEELGMDRTNLVDYIEDLDRKETQAFEESDLESLTSPLAFPAIKTMLIEAIKEE